MTLSFELSDFIFITVNVSKDEHFSRGNSNALLEDVLKQSMKLKQSFIV